MPMNRAPTAYSSAGRAGMITAATLALLFLFQSAAGAKEISLPVRPDTALIRHAIVSQMFTDEAETARVWDDGSGCNYLVLSDPRIETEEDHIRIRSNAEARVGQRVGSRCVIVTDWAGVVETVQSVEVEPHSENVRFRVVDSTILEETTQRGVPVELLWDWVKEYVHPRLGAVRLNLKPALDDLRSVLRLMLDAREDERRDALDSLTLKSVDVRSNGLRVNLAMRIPDTPSERAPPADPLSAAELARFESAWQGWDSFLMFVIKHFAAGTSTPDMRRELLDVLIEARYDLVDILAEERGQGEPDPVRILFVDTWSRLAPILRRLSPNLPGERAFNLLSFITAADALQTLDAMGPRLNIDISLDGLRRMARILAPEIERDPLQFNDQVDPELRRLFDFGPPPRLREGATLPPLGIWQWMLRPARATSVSIDEALAEKLNHWVPPLAELDSYLQSVHRLLNETSRGLAVDSSLDPELHDMYRVLVLATAWQETCWRQYTRVDDRIVPVRSPAGAVGLMQVVPNVWRGFYDPSGLTGDIAYNAIAGSEILLHYLVDYAIARGEHEQPGGDDNLAWATYAAYNGGPGHLRRYRESDTRGKLRRIDLAFRDKFQRIRNGDELAVRTCYAG